MDKKLKLRTELKKKLKQEASVTGTGASVTPGTGEGVATKYAFGKRTNKGTPKDWKTAPSIPNRPSKAMDYKELWEGYEHLRYLVSDLKNLYYSSNDDAFKKAVVDVIPDSDNYTYLMDVPEKYIQKLQNLEKMIPQARLSSPKTASEIIKNGIKFFMDKQELNEGYAQFRNATKQRSKPDQFHQAVKEVKRKMSEINRLFEYMDRLKTELSEGEDLKYKKYTENALQQIKENAKKLFFKSTKLK